MNFSIQHGFTLLEALLVLAIIGLLTALALPAYEGHQLRAARMEARQTLVEVAVEQERYRARNGGYVADAQPLRTPTSAGRRRQTSGGNYEIEVRACAGGDLDSCFIATARPRGRQTRDDCSEFSLSSDGTRGATGAEVDVCWR